MCGIAGVLGLGVDLGPDDRAAARRMTARLHHRGPDSRGFHDGRRSSLGTTRLRVIDLSPAADMPMSSPDGAVWIAYNGEVTNFRELRRRHRLDERHDFRTTSDTEVLLCLYEKLGLRFLDELTGMFAFCLLDARLGKAFLVRDQFGIRPLFYMVAAERLYFASEIKSFLDLPAFRPDLDSEGIYDFLSLAYIPGAHTPFSCVSELEGGRLVEIDLASGRHTARRYYEIRYAPDATLREADVVEPLRRAMADSVRRNLVSDAPLGLTYSGGFDTSSILALVRELEPQREVHTFSIVMDEPSFDESRYQRLMVDPAAPTHHEVRVGPRQVMASLREHMAFMDEPSGNGAAVPSYILAREAARHVKVLLSGEGGDETFNAYETHLACRMRQLYRRAVPGPLRRAVRAAAHALPADYRKLSLDFLAKRFTTGAEMGVPEAHHYWRHSLAEEDKRALMPACRDLRPTEQLFRDIYDRVDFPDPLDRVALIDLELYFVGDLMVKNDRTFMAHSVEARFPFMDRLLLEHVQRIPARLRLKGLRRRHIQKQAMKDLVPPRILRRSNMGLEMPHSLWFLGEMRPLADAYFAPDRVARLDLLDPTFVQRLWQQHQRRERDNGRGLWCILNLLLWHELFVETRDYQAYLPT